MQVMFHDDDCGEPLDADGLCPTCRFHPDMQSTGFMDLPQATVDQVLARGGSLLGLNRVPIMQHKSETKSDTSKVHWMDTEEQYHQARRVLMGLGFSERCAAAGAGHMSCSLVAPDGYVLFLAFSPVQNKSEGRGDDVRRAPNR